MENDEIYQLKNFSRDKVRVLMTLDTGSVDMTKKGIKRTDGDFAIGAGANTRPVTDRLLKALVGVQRGLEPDRYGWIREVG